jgi:hypothetical protein
MNRPVTVFVAGLVTIGIITAAVLPGRTTAASIAAAGSATSNVLGTAISGQK